MKRGTETDQEKVNIGGNKRRKIEAKKRDYKVLGGEWIGMEEGAKIAWKQKRKKIIARLEKEENERLGLQRGRRD